MTLALWPGLLLGLAALGIAGFRVYVLTWQAPVAAPALAAALSRHVEKGELAKAIALCRALAPCWAAVCAEQCLQASRELEHPALTSVVEELRITYTQRAGAGVEALRALGRMAFPLALATAIVSMSSAFVGADLEQVERALSTALQCFIVGLTSAVFCRASTAVVSRQGEARLREIAAVCRGLVAALSSTARGA
ncbi:MAG TPA: hypothetical protein VFN67_28150 [Polyangiales bacterium]|nr:hypothetical protein [Polyangiales bacterium]